MKKKGVVSRCVCLKYFNKPLQCSIYILSAPNAFVTRKYSNNFRMLNNRLALSEPKYFDSKPKPKFFHKTKITATQGVTLQKIYFFCLFAILYFKAGYFLLITFG